MAAAAPEAVALGEVLAAAGLFISWAVCLGILWVYRRSLKRMIVGFANLINVSVLGRHPLGGVSNWLRTQAGNVDHLLGEAVLASERGAVVMFKLFLNTQLWLAREIANLATDTWHLVRGVEHATVTKVTRVVTHTVVKPIRTTITVVKGTSALTTRHLTHRLDVLAARVARLTHAAGHAIATPFPRIGRLEKTAKAQGKRLTRLEKSIVGTVAAGFAVAVLAKAVVSWLRCPSLARNLKGRHCIDSDLLSALLAGTLLIVGTISLREFAEEVGSVTDEAAGLIHGFLRDV